MSENKNAKSEKLDIEALRESLKEELLKESLKLELLKELSAERNKLTLSPPDPFMEEYVEVQLFRDGKDYRDDVFVSCNGENCLIKRGVPVRIKRKFALILEQSTRQEVSAAEYQEARKREFFENPLACD